MKELILLVGPQGSGKTTLCETTFKDYFRISQDDMGVKEHLIQFEKALDRNDNIIIDRINHTREQRKRYTSLAKAKGYTTKIHHIFQPYSVCLERILNRESHPTINNNDTITAKKALNMYFDQFETIGSFEVDFTTSSSANNPISMDLGYLFYEGDRFIIIGDVHGCFQDLLNLLNKVNYNIATDVLIFCGDLVDRGPEIDKVLNFVTCLPSRRFSVRGNHDDKFIRYLRGNKVNTESLVETIKQTENMDKEKLYKQMMDFPFVITFDRYAVTHAGFHPEYDPENNSREFSLYARKYDPAIRTFTNDNTKPYWYEFKRKNDYMMETEVLFFGHEIHIDKSLVKKTDKEEIYALDAGCYSGNKLRCAVIDPSKIGVDIVEVESTQPKTKEDKSWDHINKFEPYDKLVEQGYLNKQESGDLCLYNYTEKTTFDKLWNKYTLESRGLILNKVTGDTVARPLPKFFNLSELGPEYKLPNESYEVYEKADGSLGILFLDPTDNKWKIATRGSFKSEQAIKATKMFNNVPEYEFVSHAERWEQSISIKKDWQDYTLLFEIIYPENRVNPGARLIVDYGSKETLVILAAIHKVTGVDMSYDELTSVSQFINLPLIKKYDYTLEQALELQKTIPASEEGFVIKFKSGFRIKVKGLEYLKMHRILNNITPLFIWDLMKEHLDFKLKDEYLITIPEEILPEVKEIENKLRKIYNSTMLEIHSEYLDWWDKQNPMLDMKTHLKSLGLYTQDLNNKMLHKGALFSLHKEDMDKVKKYAIMYIRPTSNLIKE